jgi:cell division FtsZ-interacting protein ZapD
MDVGARADLKTEVLKDLEQKNMCWAAIAALARFRCSADDVIGQIESFAV